ncbi:MAG: ATP-dependent helicase [Candidatus Sericytochromatia bacterium]|nr:MAG: ATP-dependent helicase [Candidatus Sericytochromatia bacterium]
MGNFITNQGNITLSERIRDLVKYSNELSFLVGYFYFSGIQELYESLKNKNESNENFLLKILVGLDIDFINNNIIELVKTKNNNSNSDLVNEFMTSLKKFINSDEYDNNKFIEEIKFFISLINSGKLIIRKTREPNHAKLYLFNISQNYRELLEKTFITGSSNLTRAGLVNQNEFNVEIKDYGFDEAKEYFDKLWEKSIKITENNELKQNLLKIINSETHLRKITPYEAFVFSLKIYIDTYKSDDENISNTINTIKNILNEKYYKLYNYQIDAIKQGLSIIKKNNGVIIADVVGLGKSIIASCIAKALKKRGIIICPPGLIGDYDSGWKKYVQDFKLYDWEIFSLGDLERALKFISNNNDIEAIIIDEAHRFRNDKTKSYDLLSNICRNKIVILLSATPFNNNPNDILSLLSLFTFPKNSNLTIDGYLRDEFIYYRQIFEKINYINKYYNDDRKIDKVRDYYSKVFENENNQNIDLNKLKEKAIEISKKIKNIIEPVVIRRNRLDIKNNPLYSEEVKNLSEIENPIEVFFELNEDQLNFYEEVLNIFTEDKFKGAIYRPFHYEKNIEDIQNINLNEEENFEYIQQDSLFLLIKRLIVKRFESSFGAFRNTIENFKNITQKILNFIEKTNKYLLDKKLIENLSELEPEEIEEELKKYSEKLQEENKATYHKVYEINKMQKKNDFIKDIKSDLNIFENIISKIDKLNLVRNDPKFEALCNKIKKLQKKEPNRKIVIFSEYLDTVKHLKPLLLERFNQRVLIIEKSISREDVKKINENFDASFKEKKNDYDILLGTDRISEGFNLNRAGVVINYDIPWNPVRVIQRVGRINRISKKVFDKLYIINFFPTKKGEDIVKSREIASNKMFMIHNILGEDSKIFSIDEKPEASALYSKLQQNPDDLEEESFYTKMISLYNKIQKENPDIINTISNFPKRIKVAKKYNKSELIVIAKKINLYIYYYDYENNKFSIKYFQDIFDSICCDKDTESCNLSDKFWDTYKQLKEYNESQRRYQNSNSIEQQALNNLKTIIRSNNSNEVLKFFDFIKNLIKDIESYGTLKYHTLKKISKIKHNDQESIINTMNELSKYIKFNYLEKEKNINIEKEIIISIENLVSS